MTVKFSIHAVCDDDDQPTDEVEVWAQLTSERGKTMGFFPSLQAAIVAFPGKWRTFTESEREDVEITDSPNLLAQCWREVAS